MIAAPGLLATAIQPGDLYVANYVSFDPKNDLVLCPYHGVMTGCGPNGPPVISTSNVYTNNYYVQGVGYYHAPFREFYKLQYNRYDPETRSYYYGGKWSLKAFESITNISSPTEQSAIQAEAARTDIVRGGFDGTSGGYWHTYG